jgi:hypothetical protein
MPKTKEQPHLVSELDYLVLQILPAAVSLAKCLSDSITLPLCGLLLGLGRHDLLFHLVSDTSDLVHFTLHRLKLSILCLVALLALRSEGTQFGQFRGLET